MIRAPPRSHSNYLLAANETYALGESVWRMARDYVQARATSPPPTATGASTYPWYEPWIGGSNGRYWNGSDGYYDATGVQYPFSFPLNGVAAAFTALPNVTTKDNDFGASPTVFTPPPSSGCSWTLATVQQKGGMLWLLNASNLAFLQQLQISNINGQGFQARAMCSACGILCCFMLTHCRRPLSPSSALTGLAHVQRRA